MGPRNLDRAPVLGSAALSSTLVLFAASIASAGIHTWDVREVFSNHDGTIQYVELFDAGTAPGGGAETGVSGGTISSGTQTHTWSSPAVAPPTNGKSYLIASATFAALPGAPTPDAIIPADKMPFFSISGDTVAFGGFDSFVFGAVPIDGINSLTDGVGVGPNTPRNYAGVQGNGIDAGGPPQVPTASFWMTAGLFASLAAMGISALRRYRATAQS
jgi:hypothetical protein